LHSDIGKLANMQNTWPSWLSGTLRLSASTVELVCGQLLFHAGQAVENLHFLLSGEVHLVSVMPDASVTVVRHVRAGEFVTPSALSDERHGSDARAIVASVIVQLPVPAFRAALREGGDLSDSFRRRKQGRDGTSCCSTMRPASRS